MAAGRGLRRTLALALAALLLAGCGGGDGDAPDPDPRAKLPPRGKLFGFSSGAFTWYRREPRLDLGISPERAAEDALAAGANSVRVPISWWATEPQPGRLDQVYLALVDRFVRRLERGGGRVLLFLGGPPPWASALPGDNAAAPRPDKDRSFGRFAALVARRYPRAAGIETWNEPNAVFGWHPAPDAARYVQVHKVAARAIRAAEPRMKVILGGLVGTPEDTPEAMRPSRYLKQLYAAGLRPADYDALALHFYPPSSTDTVFKDFRDGYRSRDPDAEVWITETGLTTTGPAAVSPKRQAAGIGPLVSDLLARPAVKAVYLHTLYDQTTEAQDSPTRGYGLLTAKGDGGSAPKPAFCALRRLVRSPPRFGDCQ